MSLIVQDTSTPMDPAPEGVHQAVCVDVVDLGQVTTQWATRPMVQVRWQVNEINPNSGKRYMVVKRYTASLASKSNLYADLVAWRGKVFSAEELKGFDLEKLIGANCQIQIVHNVKDGGRVYGNVQAVIPLAKGTAKILPLEYTRVKDRVDDDANHATSEPATDDGIPF